MVKFKFKFIMLGLAASLLLLSSCDNSTSNSGNEGQDAQVFTKQSDEQARSRIEMIPQESAVNKFKPNENSTLKGEAKKVADAVSIVPLFNLLAPEFNNEQLVSSQLSVSPSNNVVHVGYLTAGESYSGGFQSVEIDSDCLTETGYNCSTIYFSSSALDVGAVIATDDHVFAGGANSRLDELDSPAFLVREEVLPGNEVGFIDLSMLNREDLASFMVTDLALVDNVLHVVTGNQGGRLYSFSDNPDFTRLADVALPTADGSNSADMRSIAYSDNSLFLLNGDGNVYTQPLSDPTAELQLLADAGDGIQPLTNAKMSYMNGRLYIPLNEGGLAVMDAQTGEIVDRVEDNNYYSSITAVSYDDMVNNYGDRQLIFAAGANEEGAFVKVYIWEQALFPGLAELGQISFDAPQANLVQVLNNYLLVSSDSIGMQVLEMNF